MYGRLDAMPTSMTLRMLRLLRQPAHHQAFAGEPLSVVRIEVGGEHLHGDRASQGSLSAAKDGAEAAAAYELGVVV